MKTKLSLIVTLICLFAGVSAKAQNLSNIDVQQQDTVIYVSYDLQQKSDIYLYVSLNDGRSFLGPMNYVSGDVGYNVHPGEKKVVFWYAVSEMGYISNSNVKFKIVAKSSKDGYLKRMNLQYVKIEGVKPFEIGKTEVTVYQYAQFVENTGYKTTAELTGYSYIWDGLVWVKKYGVNWKTDNNGKTIGAVNAMSLPVTNLSYKDVVTFCEWAGCRLPSVEEWILAAKGGDQYAYSGSDKAGEVAWSYSNSGKKTHEVATKRANAFGIYDMCGNVAEWTSDKTGNEYIFCGGNYYSDMNNCTVDSKSHSVATGSNSLVGFRVVKASSKDNPLPVIFIDDDKNDMPTHIESRAKDHPNPLFIGINAGVGASFGQLNKSLDLTAGFDLAFSTGSNFAVGCFASYLTKSKINVGLLFVHGNYNEGGCFFWGLGYTFALNYSIKDVKYDSDVTPKINVTRKYSSNGPGFVLRLGFKPKSNIYYALDLGFKSMKYKDLYQGHYFGTKTGTMYSLNFTIGYRFKTKNKYTNK